jgi:predicted alpha/beta superfamily hydrolase
MKKYSVSIALLFFVVITSAQYKVQFVFNKLPSYHKQSNKVYLAGSFNGWNPKDEKYAVTVSEVNSITLQLARGRHEYKVTHGGWENVESGNDAFPTANRTLNVETDTTIYIEIEHWADNFPKKPKQSSATKNVKILDSAFFIPQLNRYRRVWVYLPESYSTSKKKYPVLYMHDGQNVFDNLTSGFGEWGVDEALDTLGKKYGETIVVAVDHGAEKRINEYSPFAMEKYGKGEGSAYVDFLANTLMPYINKKYRTKKDAEYTSVAGSSMGGLISLYAILKYPKKFGAAGVFSPAFWIVPQLKEYTKQKAPKVKGRIYFFAGGEESQSMVPDMLAVFEIVNKVSKANLKSHIRIEGKHNEATWREEFPLFYEWLTKKESKN